jgi:hypothetical protein
MKTNGIFRYKVNQKTETKDAKTGWVTYGDGSGEWLDGCECQIDRSIPAKHIIGTDGQTYEYNYDVFIPKYFPDLDKLMIGGEIQVIGEDGNSDEFTIQGIDSFNRKYMELWG